VNVSVESPASPLLPALTCDSETRSPAHPIERARERREHRRVGLPQGERGWSLGGVVGERLVRAGGPGPCTEEAVREPGERRAAGEERRHRRRGETGQAVVGEAGRPGGLGNRCDGFVRSSVRSSAKERARRKVRALRHPRADLPPSSEQALPSLRPAPGP
jgi:hypothetical protein